MLFHRTQNAQIALDAASIVVSDVIFSHLSKCLLAGESLAIIPLALQKASEAFHRAVVDAAGYSLGVAMQHHQKIGHKIFKRDKRNDSRLTQFTDIVPTKPSYP